MPCIYHDSKLCATSCFWADGCGWGIRRPERSILGQTVDKCLNSRQGKVVHDLAREMGSDLSCNLQGIALETSTWCGRIRASFCHDRRETAATWGMFSESEATHTVLS